MRVTKKKIVIYGVTDAFGLVVASLQRVKVLKFESAEKFLLDRHNNFEFTREFKSFVAI